MMFQKIELVDFLQNSISTVVFTKVSGEEREMRCTLLPEYLPDVTQKQQTLKESLPRAENPNTLCVWDLENNAWRSFRVDSVKTVIVENATINC